MTKHYVKLNLDRNGNVGSIQPGAVVVEKGDHIIYELREPSSTNWRFIGVQFANDPRAFQSVKTTKGGRRLVLQERRCARAKIELTLLYQLAKEKYYAAGANPQAIKPKRQTKLGKRNPVRAFDPLIIVER